MTRRKLHKAITAAVLGLAVSIGSAVAADYPNKTIRLIAPYKPGGGSDSITRALGAALEKVSGQAVVVENIPGSSGINGMLELKKAKPDGYTIAMNGTLDVTAAIAFRDKAPFQIGDFTCAGAIFNTPVWILSHKDNGYTDLGDFLEDAKAKPGKLIMGITSKLSPTDFVASTVKGTSGLNFRIVGFGGGGPLKKAILANQVNVGVIISPVLLADVKAGELNALAHAGNLQGIINHPPSRGVKHIRDWGADLDVALVRGVWLPAGVPEEVRAKMEELVKAAVESDGFKEFGMNFGFAPYSESGEKFCGRLSQEVVDLNRTLDKYMKR